MDFRDSIQLVNTLMATVAIPPSLLLLLTVNKEKGIVTPEQKRINRALSILFIGISLSALVNAVISLIVIGGNGASAHELSPYRTLFINLFFSVASWFIYFAHISIIKRK